MSRQWQNIISMTLCMAFVTNVREWLMLSMAVNDNQRILSECVSNKKQPHFGHFNAKDRQGNGS